MAELEQKIRERFLDQLDEPTWNDEDPRLDFGSAAIPCFVVAFECESNPIRRARLITIIWQFRDPAALPMLAIALADDSSEVWKNALDGIVALGGSLALSILTDARSAVGGEKREWVDEAIIQVQ